ncbi:hypothetical protein GGR95_002966 [Sulfitobacter undariae]|uniref:Uncharacterized protein n=1 Tax=Sulfitobacter undariae TaxID=1563671 RepID=A0A7W6H0V6_9RHOB|nr:hypothetical protein [Sulfitobacter undariae]MBB3995311.1 hypothetical protein [Sulfitobacter undariae]
MSRLIVTIPRSLMRVTKVNWWIDWRGQSGGSGNDGTEQVVYNKFPRWIGSPEMRLRGEAILQWRAHMMSARGRVGVFRVPMVDALSYAPDLYGGSSNGIPFNTGQRFATGQGFADTPVVLNLTAAVAGATTLEISDADAPLEIRQGVYISHNDWPYVVTSVTKDGPAKIITIETPLREAIPALGLIDLDAKGLFVAETDTMGNPEYGKDLKATPTATFVEWINR